MSGELNALKYLVGTGKKFITGFKTNALSTTEADELWFALVRESKKKKKKKSKNFH